MTKDVVKKKETNRKSMEIRTEKRKCKENSFTTDDNFV